MKTFKRISIVAASLFAVCLINSCSGEANHEEETSVVVSAENIVSVDYAVEGMVCAMGCAATIQEEVAGMTGIAACEVDYDSEMAHIEFDKTVLSEEEIRIKIESLAGGQYKVGEWVEVTEDVEEEQSSESNDKTITEVRMPSFEIPNLFRLLMEQV